VRLAVIVLGLCLAGSDVFAQAAQGTTSPPLSYAAAVQRAMAANPAIIAARLRRSINIASRDVAAERLNPEFRAEFERETPKEAYTLAVPWETGGKRARRIAVSDAAILTGEAELNATIAQVQADVRRAYFDRVIAESRQSLLADVQSLALRVVNGMTVHADRMRANLELTHGALFSQRVLLALVEGGMQRDEAYRIVQSLAQRAWDEGTPLRDLLAAEPAAQALDLDALFDYGQFTRHAAEIVGRLDEIA